MALAKRSTRKTVTASALLALSVVVCLVAGSASAGVIGVHPVLDASNGRLYVPLTPGYSGTLADPAPDGGQTGLTREKVKLAEGDKTEGAVSFMLHFALTGHVAPDFDIIADSASLLLNLEDMDFQPVDGGGARMYEWMELTVLAEVADSTPTADGPVLGAVGGLLIDEQNYGNFRDDGFAKTNNRRTIYTLSMADDLGVTAEELAVIEDNLEFSLLVTIGSYVERTKKGRGSYRNTNEQLGNSFEFATVAVPEPAALSLLVLTAPVLLLRRRH